MNKIQAILLFSIVFVAGCVGQTGQVKYKNDVITLENYVVSTLNPYSGRTTVIEYSMSNNGLRKIPYLEVGQFDLVGFEIDDLLCYDGEREGSGKDQKCVYRDVESLDLRKITIVLRAPEDLTAKTTRTISYTIKYDYTGFRQMNIPLIDPPKLKPVTKYKESSPEYGPVLLDFEPPVGAISKQGNQQIKQYWGVNGISFEVSMNLKNVGTITGGKVTGGKIQKDQFKMDLEKMKIDPDLKCVFSSSGVAEKDIEVPSKVSCNFISDDFSGDEETGVLGVEYSYSYEFTKKETFTILPLQ